MKKTDILEKYYGEFVQEKYKDVRMESDNKLDEDDIKLVNRLTEPYFWAWYARGANDGIFNDELPEAINIRNIAFKPRVRNALLNAGHNTSHDLFNLVDLGQLREVTGLGGQGQEIVLEWVRENR